MSDAGSAGGVRMTKTPSPADMEQLTSAAAYQAADEGPQPRAGRFWSARRAPAGVVALLVLGGAGLSLYDVSAVRTHHPAMAWRRRLAHELATRPLDDAWIIGSAAAAMAVGLWLLLLALTPGLRGLLPIRPESVPATDADGTPVTGTGGIRAGIERSAVALLLRDRAMEVSGVRSATVRVGRRKIRVRARAHFRELDEVRADLDATLGEAVRDLGLSRRPGLSVHVRRPGKR